MDDRTAAKALILVLTVLAGGFVIGLGLDDRLLAKLLILAAALATAVIGLLTDWDAWRDLRAVQRNHLNGLRLMTAHANIRRARVACVVGLALAVYALSALMVPPPAVKTPGGSLAYLATTVAAAAMGIGQTQNVRLRRKIREYRRQNPPTEEQP